MFTLQTLDRQNPCMNSPPPLIVGRTPLPHSSVGGRRHSHRSNAPVWVAASLSHNVSSVSAFCAVVGVTAPGSRRSDGNRRWGLVADEPNLRHCATVFSLRIFAFDRTLIVHRYICVVLVCFCSRLPLVPLSYCSIPYVPLDSPLKGIRRLTCSPRVVGPSPHRWPPPHLFA